MSSTTIVDQLREDQPLSDAAACLAPLLDALTWRGTPRQFAEAITGSWRNLDIRDLRNTMANLNFGSTAHDLTLGKIDPRLLPCLFEGKAGEKLVLWRNRNGDMVAYDGGRRQIVGRLKRRLKGIAYFFAPEDPEALKKPRTQGWFRPIIRRFEPFIVQLMLLSLALNALALATPLFVMAVYDQVIGARSGETLPYLAFGVLMAIGCDAVIRMMRSSLLAFVGGRLDVIVNNGVVDKILDMPLARLEKASVGTQLSRLREFEGIRGFFAGPMAVAFLEMPFVLIFLVTIAVIGGWLAVVPVVLMAILGGGAVIALRYTKAAVADTVAGNSDCQGVLIEILENLRFIKDEGTEEIWMERFRERSTSLAMSGLQGARINAGFQIFAQSIMTIAGATTLAVGAVLAINGQFSTGALIACMAMVWRVLAPLQTLFIAFTKLSEVKNAINRIDQLMAQPSETQIKTSGETVAQDRDFEGRVAFSRVVMRYTANHEPALAGVSFEINPGEIVAIVGANGSGKSTILKLVADLYKPQAGTVFIDGVDTRQLNVLDLRQSIGYMPQKADLFSGTIVENLKIANPIATRNEVEDACHRSGILDDVYSLPNGLDTELTEQTIKQVSTGFRKGLVVARTLLSNSNIMLFDEPSVALDVESDEMLKKQIEEFRGKVTTLLVTHRPDYVRLADRALAIRKGRLVFDGTPSELAGMGRKA